MCLFSTNSALYFTCMYDKIHLKCYLIVLHFLSFLFFIILFYFINTQNCLLKNVSFGYTLYRTIHRNFAHVIFNIVKQKGIIWRTRSKLIQWSKRQWQSVPRKLQENLLPSAFSWERVNCNLRLVAYRGFFSVKRILKLTGDKIHPCHLPQSLWTLQ